MVSVFYKYSNLSVNCYICAMFNDFKPILKILLRFVIIYLVMVFLYQVYLNRTEGISLDPFSVFVGEQVTSVQNFFGISSKFEILENQQAARFIVIDKYVSRMVEGCNAISVMILFLAFIFAFYKGFKTFIFAIAGLVLLHIMNVLRIAGLNWVLYFYPPEGKMFHDYIFPAIIYGSVVVLWLVWINYFALKKSKNA